MVTAITSSASIERRPALKNSLQLRLFVCLPHECDVPCQGRSWYMCISGCSNASRCVSLHLSLVTSQYPAAGVHISLLMTFIMRIPIGDTCCQDWWCAHMKESDICTQCYQDQIGIKRIQRRVLHQVSQASEQHLDKVLSESMPTPEKSDDFHPATKCLGSSLLVFSCPRTSYASHLVAHRYLYQGMAGR